VTKLYELPRQTYFKLLSVPETPPGGPECTREDIYFLSHIDGMYSYCLDNNKQIVHLAAWSEVERIEE
jgi:hypothetical protein